MNAQGHMLTKETGELVTESFLRTEISDLRTKTSLDKMDLIALVVMHINFALIVLMGIKINVT